MERGIPAVQCMSHGCLHSVQPRRSVAHVFIAHITESSLMQSMRQTLPSHLEVGQPCLKPYISLCLLWKFSKRNQIIVFMTEHRSLI